MISSGGRVAPNVDFDTASPVGAVWEGRIETTTSLLVSTPTGVRCQCTAAKAVDICQESSDLPPLDQWRRGATFETIC